MEASAVHVPALRARSSASPLLKLRSDEQLLALLREGNDHAFRVIHDRYRQRLFAYIRQMLGATSRQDAEDVLQDVFARAYTALRADRRAVQLRPWLYRVAHNRCIDYLRRPVPVTTELFESAGKPLHDPFDDVQRREDLKRLVDDIGRLPEQQRSALLMREMNGLSYEELAAALDVTVPAIKSLLVRARVELVETAEARAADCVSIREELTEACDSRARVSPRARRHLRDCSGCEEYRDALRGMQKSFAALSPVAVAAPLALLGKLLGVGGTAGGSGGGAGAAGLGAGLGGATAGKVAVVVSTAAIATGGAIGIERRSGDEHGGSTTSSGQAGDGIAGTPLLAPAIPGTPAAGAGAPLALGTDPSSAPVTGPVTTGAQPAGQPGVLPFLMGGPAAPAPTVFGPALPGGVGAPVVGVAPIIGAAPGDAPPVIAPGSIWNPIGVVIPGSIPVPSRGAAPVSTDRGGGGNPGRGGGSGRSGDSGPRPEPIRATPLDRPAVRPDPPGKPAAGDLRPGNADKVKPDKVKARDNADRSGKGNGSSEALPAAPELPVVPPVPTVAGAALDLDRPGRRRGQVRRAGQDAGVVAVPTVTEALEVLGG